MAIKHVVNFNHLVFLSVFCVTYTTRAMTEQHAIKMYIKIIWLYLDPLKLFQLECYFSPWPHPQLFDEIMSIHNR